MAGPMSVLDVTYKAGEDLSNSQYRVVVSGTSNYECKLPSGGGVGKILGVLQNYPASGSAARVRKLGISKVVAGGTIVYGAELEIEDAAGRVDTYTQDGDNGRVGSAEESAIEDDIFTAFICPLDISQLLS
jgi:hypothetical protein